MHISKAHWKSVSTVTGEQCVIMDGQLWMQTLHADNLVIPMQVNTQESTAHTSTLLYMMRQQQAI